MQVFIVITNTERLLFHPIYTSNKDLFFPLAITPGWVQCKVIQSLSIVFLFSSSHFHPFLLYKLVDSQYMKK